MSRLIESIRLLNGQFNNLAYHERRMMGSIKALYGVEEKIDLAQILETLDYPQKGLYKCRVLYDQRTKAVEFVPYTIKPITSLKLVVEDSIAYEHKFSDRSHLNQLFETRDGCDDILIIKKGCVTDSSYANIVLKAGSKWYTPQTCLLKGTMRESLIHSGEILEQQIKASDINKFKKFKLINSMLGFEGPECDISNIF